MCLLVTVMVHGQDKIFKKNGEVIEARVSAINGETVVFKRFDNLQGPEYSIPKADVARIKYTNGTEDIFEVNNDHIGVNTTKETAGNHRKYLEKNKNIYSLAPIMLTENGFGLGISVEHNLDKTGWVSFYLPLIATFNLATSSYTNNPRMDPMVYLMPGVKIYTNLNSPRKTKYSIGPAMIIGAGRSTTNTSYFANDPDPYSEKTRFVLGAMAVGGINLFPTPYLYVGADYGLGLSYLNQYNGVNKNVVPLTQLSFKIGYRL